MASRSPAIFLLLALPLLCYVVSIEAHTLPDNIVPDSRGLSEEVVPEFSLEARATKGLKDEVNEFIEARATKGLKDEVNEFIEAQATKGLKDEVTKFMKAVKSCDSLGDCPTTIEHCLGGVSSGHLSDDCHGCAVCIAGKLDITLHDLISKVGSRLTKALNGGLLQSRVTRVVDDDDEMDQFMQATSRSRLTKGQNCYNNIDANGNPCTVGCTQRRLLGGDSDSSGC